MTAASPAFAILTWGCQMNEDDSDQMSSLLMQMGYARTKDVHKADIIVLNTCSVRAKPEQKVLSKLGILRELKQENPDLIIAVCGCMAQRRGPQLRKTMPHVDLVIGTAQVEKIPELINEVMQKRRPKVVVELPRAASDESTIPTRTQHSKDGLKAFVPITYGCNNFCAYCIVPYVRGKERSRPLTEIVDEIRKLADTGCQEVTLLGQNVNSYAGDGGRPADFSDLLSAVNDISGIERIRFTTSHPKDMSDKLIEAMAGLPKVCEHIHLAMQAGDDEILQRMRRGYTVEHYMERVSALRAAVPEVAITTDILIGFPGETEGQFENTLQTIEEIRFDAAFMFAFNPIAGTVAAELPDQLTTKLKNQRLSRVIELQNRISVEINQSQIDWVYEVMVEGISPKDTKRVTGLTRQNKTMNFAGSRDLVGKTVKVSATEGHLYGFVGEIAL